jgi:transposase
MAKRYVGMDLHRRRSVIYVMNDRGEKLSCVRIANDATRLLEEVGAAGDDCEVVIEATYGWYWAVDLLQEHGYRVHLAHPAGNDWGKRRVKNDERDARDLADLLRLGRLAEAWIAPPETRQLRELVRYRAKLVNLRSGLKAQVHAVMAKEGVLPACGEMFGVTGNTQLDGLDFADAYALRVTSLRDLIKIYDREVLALERELHRRLKHDAGYQAVQTIPGIGRVLGAIFVAEIGDIGRFATAEALCSWAGVTPKHRESDTKVVRGPITKMGSKLVRWAAIEAVSGRRPDSMLRHDYVKLVERRGKYKARTAVARKLLTLVFYALRDGEVRCLQSRPDAA